MPDFIFVSLENWDEIWRRNQHICSKLVKRLPRSKILFVGLPWDIADVLKPGFLGKITRRLRAGRFEGLPGKTAWTVPDLSNITITRPFKFFPDSFRWGRLLNEAITRKQILREAVKIGIKDPILWLNPHFAVHMAGKMNECLVVYDITDDYTLARSLEKEKHLIRHQDHLLCKKADLVIVCSKALEASRRGLCKQILLLPNGVDPEHYKCVPELSKGKGKHRWPSPVFGYTGSLLTDRLDISLIIALARAFPQGSVALVGPDYLPPEERKLLASEKNIYLQGIVPHADIADYMSGFDVCIVPHLEYGFTESLNPLKLWEYLACGKPIVSTNVAGFRDYSHLCHIAPGPDNFISACKDALHESGELESVRMAEAAKNSWDSRIDRLLEVLRSLKNEKQVSAPNK